MSQQWMESKDNSSKRKEYYGALVEAFKSSSASLEEKLDSFPKFVPSTAVARFLARYEMYKMIQDVPGAIIEAGVLSGAGLLSFSHFAFLFEPHNHYRQIVGFDTFEGFPDISDVDRKGTSEYLEVGMYKSDVFEELRAIADIHEQFRFLTSRKQIHIVKGDITETVPKYLEEHPELVVALLYLDCDLYKPTLTCINAFVPLMPKGAVIVFDELGLSDFPGETKALRDSLGISALRIRKYPFLKAAFAVIE